MPEPLRDLIRFALALWREWQVLLTGGSIVALLALWAFATGKTMPQNLAWLVIGLTFVMAAFLAWRKEATAAANISQENGCQSESSVPLRVFIEQDPQALCEIYDRHTRIIADQMTSAYKGKWLRVEVEVAQVSHYYPKGSYIVVGRRSRLLFVLVFNSEWRDHISVIYKGQMVLVIGRLNEIGSGEINLIECEIFASDAR